MTSKNKSAMDAVDKVAPDEESANIEKLKDELYKSMEEEMDNEVVAPPEPPRTYSATLGADGYEQLAVILKAAFSQSAHGKGRERHANGPIGFRPWHQQPILEISRMVGPGYAAGQVAKKVQEACTMHTVGNLAGAKAEALGAIVYAAALYKLLHEVEHSG